MGYRPEDIRDESGKWLNSQVFRQEAIKFGKNGYYNVDPPRSNSWYEYWDEQLKRCKEGYEVAGHKITNQHYNYLNFTQIMKVVKEVGSEEGAKKAKKVRSFPDFWDGDYDYFWSIEIAENGICSDTSQAPSSVEEREKWNVYNNIAKKREIDLESKRHAYESDEIWLFNKQYRDEISLAILGRLKLNVKPHLDYLDGGHHIVVGKCRRKGYSFKNAAICANIYNTVKESLTIIGAFDKKYLYPKGTMGMASTFLSFYNKSTAWSKAREYVNKQEHKRASYQKWVNGVKDEAGYMSEVIALTFKDNPDAARGKDARYVLLEEAGAFPNLRNSFNATAPSLAAGKYITGQILVFGTGGDMESGTVDFAHMFYNPLEFNCMPFINIWDENAENSVCGFFHPVYMNMEGYYDEQGNSNKEGAIANEKQERARIISASTSSLALQSRVQEWPLCPSEAFLTVSINDFPIVELQARLNIVKRENLHLKIGQAVYLRQQEITEEDGFIVDEKGSITKGKVTKTKVTATPDLDNIIDPIWSRKPKNKDLRGGVVVFEAPIQNAPRGLYKIGFDPYRQVNGESLACIYVYKAHHKFSFTRDMIVAEYVGRPYSPEEVNRICEMLCEYYGAQVMHENEVTHVKDYFRKRKKLHLLAQQPDAVIASATKKSKVNRVFGCHMSEKMKDAGEKYIKDWLLEERDIDEEGNILTNLDFIYDPALLEELINYNRKGNFDRVMALMMVMFQLTQDGEDKVYDDDTKGKKIKEQFASLFNRQYKNAA